MEGRKEPSLVELKSGPNECCFSRKAGAKVTHLPGAPKAGVGLQMWLSRGFIRGSTSGHSVSRSQKGIMRSSMGPTRARIQRR